MIKTLDIGCGSGVLVDMLSKYYEAWGTDLSRPALVYCKEYRRGVYRTMQNIEYDYDLITAFQVLEHLPYPELMLDVIKESLKPGGYLYIEVPNTSQPLAMSARGTDHRICFTIHSLTELLKRHGFKIIKTRTLTLSENIAANVIDAGNRQASKYIKVSGRIQNILNCVVKKIRESEIINLATLPRRIALDRKQQGYNILCLAQKGD